MDVPYQTEPVYREPLYTVTEVAQRLSVCERTIYDALRAKRLKGVKIGKLWRVKEAFIEEWLRQV